MSRGTRVTVATLISVLSLTYLLPFAVAYGRDLPNRWPIFVVNLFLSWTLIGWVIALAWALSARDA